MSKLSEAKENFIFRTTASDEDTEVEDVGIMFENPEDCETITLNQIAHQFTEIENIYKTVRDVPVRRFSLP